MARADIGLKKTKRVHCIVNGKSTTVQLNVLLVALWLLLTESYTGKVPSTIILQKFISEECVTRWKRKRTNGFSMFVTLCMIRSITSIDDFKEFRRILNRLNKGK